jgi:hypothetical protein
MTKKISLIALCFCYIVMIYTAFVFYPRWEQTRTEATLSWDVSGYYLYLPALFIYKDLKHCAFKGSILSKYYPTPDFQQAFLHKNSGNYVMKYASGQAITMLPFFLVAHTYCKINDTFPADGFSFPYQFCIGVGMLLYAFLGLFILRKVLLNFFKDTTVALLLVCYVIGSNYLNFSSIDQAMTHNVLFTIYSFIIYFTIKFHKNPTTLFAIIIGSLVGLATLIRPTDVISIIIPYCWNINSFTEIGTKFRFVQQHFFKFTLMAVFVCLVFSIQMIYWKYVANEWLVYSYEKQGFSWLHPHVFDYALSYHCGWLRYCPMMVLPLLGLIYYFIKGKHSFSIVLFIILNTYIVMAWDIWDYGGTAGRAMVQAYPVLAFPFCLLIERMQKSRWTSTPLYASILLFAYLNIWWTYHAHAGNIQIIGLTKEYYWKVVGRWHGTDEDKKLLDNPHAFYGVPKNKIVLYAKADNSNTKIRINKEIQSTEPIIVKNIPSIKKWVRATATFHCTLKEWDVWRQAQFIIQFYDKEKVVQTNFIKIHRFISNGESKQIYIDALSPKDHWTSLSISFWNADGDKELQIDNVEVVSFDD